MESLWSKIEPLLIHVSRPGRYAGNELHALKKSWTNTEVHFALAFPDAYEIGMSHLGMEILYHVLNKLNWTACERVYSVWPDMEKKMRENEIPLFSLESKTPVRLFDILGISLQYELQYTNVLNLIDLAGLPLFSKDRGERDPLVIAGGPCAFNPEPLADFLDAFVLGDGEEVVVEIAELVRQRKRGHWTRQDTLMALSKVEGIYVPSLHTFEPVPGESSGKPREVPFQIKSRTLHRLSPEHVPETPLLPLIQVTHDRLSIEIMRGCSRGCRFCSAGMTYRPVRTRTVDDLVRHAEKAVANTGYDEISLVSLSSSDYPDLPALLRRLQEKFSEKGISISFPSLRPDTFTPEMAALSSGLRKSGLTLAPEAGTQRLRDVINKNNTEEDLLRAVRTAFENEWKRVKLYFMIGLPTETEDDLKGMADLVGKVVLLSRPFGRKQITVSISPFSPKPHTPFQWEAQDTVAVLEEKIAFLRRHIRWREVELNWRDPRISRLETVLGRGDRKSGRVLLEAWRKGARFDAWGDMLDLAKWDAAFAETGVSADDYTSLKNTDIPLPWSRMSKGFSESFLLNERAKALQARTTPDCRTDSCSACGLQSHPSCGAQKKPGLIEPQGSDGMYGKRMRRVLSGPVVFRIRCEYIKGAEARFSSHLDTIRMFVRTLRRANVPVAHSQGYHAHPLLSFGPPLPLGYTSLAEYVDMDLLEHVPRQLDKLLNRNLHPGFEVRQVAILPAHSPSLDSTINLARYWIQIADGYDPQRMSLIMERFLRLNSFKVRRREKEVDIRLHVSNLACGDGGLDLSLRIGSGGSARPDEVLEMLYADGEEPPQNIRIERTKLYVEKQGAIKTPMEIIRNE
jgi:radical SAM family uncharacterized protein/radical SAM-linked protein